MKFNPPKEDVNEDDFYKSTAMAAYLEKYVDEHIYSGTTLRDRIRFACTVNKVDQTTTGWTIHYARSDKPESITTRKLIVASGSTSVPNMPSLPGRDTFGGPIVHTVEYGRSKIFARQDIKSVAVIGGGKSAADMVYANVKAGREVKWIIRASGKGPGVFVDVQLKAGYIHNAGELGVVRAAASLLTLPGLQAMSWWQWFLYDTRVGSWVLGKYMGALTSMLTASARYDDRPGARETFKLLKTDVDAASLQTPAGGKHHADFWDVVARNVDVYRKDIERLAPGKIVFTDGTWTDADAILCGTGFKDTIPFFTEEQRIQLGLPHAVDAEPPEMQKEWEDLNATAEEAVRKRFYTLRDPPPQPQTNKWGDVDPSTTPFRLYNCIIPTSPSFNHSIAFVGFATLTNMYASSELGAIYATAYLDGHLTSKLPSEQDMKRDVAYVTSYMRMRTPTYGRAGNWYVMDFHQCVDRWMGDVGLVSYRGKGWWRDRFHPLFMEDFGGLRDEYVGRYGRGER